MYSISNAKRVIGGINTFIHDTNEIVIDRLLELALENIQDFTEEQKEKLNEVVFKLKDELFKESLLTTIQQKKKKTGPKRPPTEYNIFIKNKIDELKITNPELKNTQLMSKAAELWSLNKKERQEQEEQDEQEQKTNLET
tara:strand:- start:14131 stop:14550 length:420 start_codon:yes stop_codon:yes gene_type:complete